ncbi:hypothetical protein AA106556_1121 [Neokomagataea tanensis NBRC 106556]|uniref:Transposase n=1 Tax=Neokomagataea tanensis NBRC 106556 TaxID=1223519 RepID=A0ABQ0QIZ0_9PROT|nr:hypothetical protein AA106556_1121 [Neokomagataea tanensis NBRC 106556]
MMLKEYGFWWNGAACERHGCVRMVRGCDLERNICAVIALQPMLDAFCSLVVCRFAIYSKDMLPDI